MGVKDGGLTARSIQGVEAQQEGETQDMDTNSVRSFLVLVTTYLHKTGFCKWKKVKDCFCSRLETM